MANLASVQGSPEYVYIVMMTMTYCLQISPKYLGTVDPINAFSFVQTGASV